MAEYTIYIYNHYNDHVKSYNRLYNISDIMYILLIVDSYIHVYMYVK